MQHRRASQRTVLPATARFLLLTDQPRWVNRGSAPAAPRRVTWTLIAPITARSAGLPACSTGVESCLADNGQLLAG